MYFKPLMLRPGCILESLEELSKSTDALGPIPRDSTVIDLGWGPGIGVL